MNKNYEKARKKYIAHDCNVTLQTVYNWYCGRSMPTKDNLGRLHRIFKCDYRELFDFFEEKNQNFINNKSK